MLAFVVRRLVAMVGILLAISVIVFLIFFATPGVDPAKQMAGRDATPQTIAVVRHEFGLDKPLPVQYLLMMKHLFITHDLRSYANQGAKVVPEVLNAAPVTLSLVCGALVIWLVVSFLMGTAGALLVDTPWDALLTVVALIALSVPVFWLGQVANLVTQDRLHDTFLFSWVPAPGYVPLTTSVVGWFKSLVIPWLVLSASFVGLYSRVLRASILETQDADYVRLARAKGVPERRVLLRHVIRTSLVSFVSLLGLDLGALIGGGALLVEVVFGLRGIGYLTYQSLSSLDLPVIMATVMFSASVVVIANALVDIAYAALDPRVRLR